MKEKPLRILMVAPTPFFSDRGCHVHIAEQALALQNQGHEVVVTTYSGGREVSTIRTERTTKLLPYDIYKVGPSWKKIYLDPLLLFKTLKTTYSFRPDVIHGHLHEGCFIGWITARIFGLPLIFDCQGSLTGELIAHNFSLAKPKVFQRMWHGFETWLDGRADGVLAQSSSMRSELIDTFHVPASRITMTYDGVNTHTFSPKEKDSILLKNLRIPEESRIIVFLGVLTPYQGVDDLLEALPIIIKQIPNVMLLIMGYPNVEHYKERAKELQVASSVRFTGRVKYEDAKRYLTLGDIAVTPKRSQTEANGKIYNYMACGLPTVAFDTIVNRDILGDLGIYVKEAGNPESLASSIINLLNDSNKRTTLAQKVRKRAVEKYSWDNVAQRITSAYYRVMIPWQLQVFTVSVRKKEKWLWAKRQLVKVLKKDSMCLDIGSGVGTLSVLQEQLGGKWEFTETDAAAARETQAIVQGNVHTTDIFDTKLPQNHYDVITLFDVIEHVPDPTAFLQRAHELLKPNGVMLITTPADDGGFYFWRRVADTFFGIDKAAHDHVVEGFSRKELRELTQKSGFTFQLCNAFSFFFTEMVELAYNGAYILKNRSKQKTKGYNLALSPASPTDVSRHSRELTILRILYPLLRALSLLDRVFPFRKGYEWGVVVRRSS